MTSEFNFADKFLLIKAGAKADPYATLADARADGASVIARETFLNNVVFFIVVAAALFFVVRWINRLRRPDTPAAPNTKACPFCKSSIDISATRCPHCTSALNV
jgi:large conductance mechanosensitive channel